MERDADPPGDRPRDLALIATSLEGYIVSADGARTYLDRGPAWKLMAQLVQPALNVEPQGNC